MFVNAIVCTIGAGNFIKEQKVIWIREKDVFDELQYRYTWWGEPRNASARRQSFMDVRTLYSPLASRSGTRSPLQVYCRLTSD